MNFDLVIQSLIIGGVGGWIIGEIRNFRNESKRRYQSLEKQLTAIQLQNLKPRQRDYSKTAQYPYKFE